MPRMRKILGTPASVALVAGVLLIGALAPMPAQAQDTCGDLWLERNGIYARKGYCFKTSRALATFGTACFPPYGRLSREERRRVNEIQAEEDALGCPR